MRVINKQKQRNALTFMHSLIH